MGKRSRNFVSTTLSCERCKRRRVRNFRETSETGFHRKEREDLIEGSGRQEKDRNERKGDVERARGVERVVEATRAQFRWGRSRGWRGCASKVVGSRNVPVIDVVSRIEQPSVFSRSREISWNPISSLLDSSVGSWVAQSGGFGARKLHLCTKMRIQKQMFVRIIEMFDPFAVELHCEEFCGVYLS